MDPSEINPYAPPVETTLPPVLAPALFYFCDGDFLVVRDGAELPHVCVRTNAPAAEDSWRKKVTMTWCSPWVFLLILIHFLVAIIVMVIIQKKAKVTYCLSAAARASIVRKRSIGFVLLMTAIALIVAAIKWNNDYSLYCGLGSVALLIGSLVFFAIANPVKAVKSRDGWFRIKGCSREFLATLPVQQSPF